MAKRKRLSPAVLAGPAPEIPQSSERGMTSRPPIADVSGDAAARSAFEEVAHELKSARDEGRMIARLPLDAVDRAYLIRDRMVPGGEDMAMLIASIRTRGQQTPIEVVDLGGGRYGLISGLRRVTALYDLYQETREDAFATVQAVIRTPQTAAEAYCAMVEENEVRSDLSFYERARIVVKATEQGIYPDLKAAVQGLFGVARAPKRSKIMAFASLVVHLGDVLCWPDTIPEKQGLALAAALKARPELARDLRAAVMGANKAAEERAALEQVLRDSRKQPVPPPGPEVVPGVRMQGTKGKIILQGAHVDGDLIEDLRCWLQARATN